MKKHIIAFASVTQANKAKNLFARHGISSEIKRTPGNFHKGCGYSVTAAECAERLIRIMESEGVSYKSISETSDRQTRKE